MQVEDVTSQDTALAGQVADLFVAYRAFYGRTGDEDDARAFLRTRLARGDSLVRAAVVDGDAVAFAQVYPQHSSLGLRTTWLLNDLFATPAARGTGAGSALVAHVLAEAGAAGAHEVRLETHPDNARARALYERHGFRLATDVDQDGEFVTYVATPA